MDQQIYKLAETIWDYHRMKQRVAKADAILVLCSHDERVAERGAQLFLEGFAPLIVFSGGHGAITSQLWREPEAERFARIAMSLNVPRESILIEPESTNTGENFRFTKRLLEQEGLNPHKFIVVQKPYMERRSYATFRKMWPEKEVIVTSPQVSFRSYLEEYANRSLSTADVVSIMVGDLQRIKIYPARGFQIEQEIPEPVWQAFEVLVRAVYDKYLIQPQDQGDFGASFLSRTVLRE